MDIIKKNKKKWYAVYTKSRWEKKVYERLQQNDIVCYLPFIKTLKQWSDRKKWIEEPLFKSYIFVKIFEKEYIDVLSVIGVVSFVKIAGAFVSIPEQQIIAVKEFLLSGEKLPNENEILTPGDKIEIKKGLLIGLIGILVKVKGKHKVIIEIEAVGQSISVNIPLSHLKLL